MKVKTYIIISIVLLITAGCRKKDGNEAQAVPEIDVSFPVVDSVVLHKTYPGLLSANNEVDVVSEVSGEILSQNYTSGQYVSKGQVLFTIDGRRYSDAVKQAEATLSNARSRHNYASRQFAAMSKALKADAVSQMEVLQARSSMEQAAADIESASASLRDARLSLSKCVIRAPISGYITSPAFDPGAYVNGQGAPVTLATIYDNSQLGVVFSIEDSQYELMTGDGGISDPIYRHVPIKFNKALPHEYTTDLYFEGPNVDKTTGTLQLKGILDNPYKELKSGLYCTVQLPYGVEPHAVLVRDASIGTDQLGKYLYLVNDSDKVVYRHIEVGDVYNDSLRIVTKGVGPKDRYVISALLKVRNGMKVNPRLIGSRSK